MIKYFSSALKITNNNIILATPLILFMLLVSLYKSVNVFQPNLILIVNIISFLMWAAFLSGWCYIVRQAILIDDEDISKDEKVKKSFSLMGMMLKGIGDYFLPFAGFLILYACVFAVIILVAFNIGKGFIGDINFPWKDLLAAAQANNQEAVNNLLNGLSKNDALNILKWFVVFLGSATFFSYITMFWAPEIIKNTRNSLKAFFISNKFLWKNFINTLLFFAMIGILQFVVMFLCSCMSLNPILSYLSLLVYFYFMVYVVVLVFYFYEKYETKGNSDSRADSIGQDCLCDKSGEEN